MASPKPEPPDWKRADPKAREYVLRILKEQAQAADRGFYGPINATTRRRAHAAHAAIALLSKEAGNG